MNHHYPDNYHGGYVRGASGMQGMGYGHGGYDDPSAMARMGHPRNSYPMPQYGDNGQMHSMMQHQQQGGMYSHGGYMGQMGGNHYGMGGYSSYNMPNMNHAGMNNPGTGMSMGPRGHMMGSYYNHPVSPHHSGQQQQQHTTMGNQSSSSGYTQSPNGSNPSMQHGQSQMMGTPVNSQSSSQASHHPSSMQRNQGSVVATSTPSHGMPVSQANNSSNFPNQASSPHNNLMMPGSHTQPRPVAGMSGGSSHPIPQHPMRHPTTQQSPQEVADNILQIASSYPTNQTVQVPLKSRHAPYHIPRSPHYSMSSSETSHSSPAANHFQQPSPASQPSPTPSTSSVKSPTPALAPIPNPIPSPGISGIKSPTSHCLSPCGSQRSPSHMASSYSGHCQTAPSPQHYSPGGRGTPQHLSTFAHSPPPSRNTSLYPSSNDQTVLSQSDNQSLHANFSITQQSSSPQTGNMMTSSHSSMTNVQFNQQCGGNNPLMSLQKLVMLPETQVVDPKSVVNDACLASHSNENNANSKNCEDPAERSSESSGLSVGCSGQSSSLGSQSDHFSQGLESLASSLPGNDITQAPADDRNEINELYTVDENNLTDTILSQNPGVNQIASQKDTVSSVEQSDIPLNELSNAFGENQGLIEHKNISPHPELESAMNSQMLSMEDDNSNACLMQQAWRDNSSALQNQSLTDELENQTGKELSNEHAKEIKTECEDSSVPEVKSNEENLKTSNTNIMETLNETVSVTENQEEKKDMPSQQGEQSEVLLNIKKEDPQTELKQVLPECKSPGVLSEVQVVVNGNDASDVTEDDGDKECEKSNRPKLRNGLNCIVRAKIGRAKKASQFMRLTTPCSIAVGADEREVCEQFAFRRNGYCHALRASRLLYSGRSRQDSTGHGDSDESVENISDSNFHVLGNPQDGCKKKSIAKKNDTKQSNSTGQAKTNSKEEVMSKGSSNSSNISNVQVSSVSEKNDLSDDDCYYEGVDSSDFIMLNNSSDDSFSSSHEAKQMEQMSVSTPDDVQDNSSANNPVELKKKVSADSEKQVVGQEQKESDSSSPPAKRTRRSPGQKLIDTSKKSSMNSDTVANGTGSLNDIHSKKISKEFNFSKRDENSSERENGKIAITRSNKRKPVLGKLPTNGQTKLPEAVVKLEKSEFLENSANFNKVDLIDLTNSPKDSPTDSGNAVKLEEETNDDTRASSNGAHHEGTKVLQDIKMETQDLIAQDNTHASPSKSNTMPNKTNKKKKPAKRKQNKANIPVHKDKEEEVKDSFKSMKFSRTLDMMKSVRKKENNFSGPFVRVVGSRQAPKCVSVCNQSSTHQTSINSKQNQKSANKQTVSNSSAIHMVSNLPNNTTALVSSTKTVGQQGWACAFCNHQSSFHSLGDVFGPYFKEEDLHVVEHLASEETKKTKETSTEKKGGPSKKRKSPVKKELGPQEVWVHEACALWAPGVYLIGNKLYGMDEAIKDGSESICSACKEKGAMTGCLHKGCAMKYHISCAIDKGCCLDEENLSLLCPKHKDKKLHNLSASTSRVS